MSSKHITQFRQWLLSSPPAEWALNQLRELLIGTVRQGPVPQHVAFVMDGNRRFARNHRIETIEGHHLGFEALARILEVCYKSGVKVVTIYAFSIENFKRSKFEVDALMDMAKYQLTQIAEHGELLDRYGASFRIQGQRELVKPDVLEAVDRAVEMTKDNNKAVLNVCFPYTSREEITTAIRSTVSDYTKPIQRPTSPTSRSQFSQSRIEHNIRTQSLNALSNEEKEEQSSKTRSLQIHSPSASSITSEGDTCDHSHDSPDTSTTIFYHDSHDSPDMKPISDPTISQYPSPELITSEVLDSHMHIPSDPPLDILIRTSGVERLSDFMLWQCHEDTDIVFLKTMWPAFDLWQFLPVIWEWQYKQKRRAIGKSQVDDLVVKVS